MLLVKDPSQGSFKRPGFVCGCKRTSVFGGKSHELLVVPQTWLCSQGITVAVMIGVRQGCAFKRRVWLGLTG